jgi:hypothetical protein
MILQGKALLHPDKRTDLGLLFADTEEVLAGVGDAGGHLLGVRGAELRHIDQGHGQLYTTQVSTGGKRARTGWRHGYCPPPGTVCLPKVARYSQEVQDRGFAKSTFCQNKKKKNGM